MRIQHNIMAMNAYRNYMGNTNALAKNLEKLSSGYKINRAGDDAAGLAISEKMRAQITGLDAAQKNVNDGISLVQTAEGAMQEVQDMLNRMVYLATQSANGTYDNTTDRANLQKEVDQLREEINRIADSANFNGIKLLDGTMDAGGVAGAQTVGVTGVDGLSGDFMLPALGNILGTDTVLHQDSGTVADATSFSVDLHNVEWDNTTADFELKVGDASFKIAKGAASDATGATKAIYETDAITEPATAAVKYSYSINGKTIDITGEADEELADHIDQIVTKYNALDDVDFVASKNAAGTGLEFVAKEKGTVASTGATVTGLTQVADGTGTAAKETTAAVQLTGASSTPGTAADTLAVTIGGKTYDVNNTATSVEDQVDAWVAAYNNDTANTQWVASKNGTNSVEFTAKKVGSATTLGLTTPITGATLQNDGADGTTAATYKLDTIADPTTSDVAAEMTIAGKTVDMTGKATLEEQLAHFVSEWNDTPGVTGYTASVGDDGDTIVFTADAAGGIGGDGPAAEITGADINEVQAGADASAGTNAGEKMDANDILTAIKGNGEDVTVTGATVNDDGSIKIGNNTYNVAVNGSRMTFTQVDGDTGTDSASMKVSVNVGTADSATGVTGDYNVSTTVISQKGEALGERLASTVFTLTENHVADGASITIGKDTYTFTTDAKKIGTDGYIDATGTLEQTIQKLTDATANNSTYTVGNEGGGKISITENKGQTDFDLSKAENIAKSLGFTTVSAATGKGLTLQIGDTSDSYNQLTVSIGDMHVDSLGIGDISIATQAGAQAAVDKIKAAINNVSMTRGTLGATQNRLEHTANNLAVMEENITNAESAIRDTDIAEEMMAYTKNNILIQSAQAMLAQANMVPQGVLQLLQ